MTDLPARPLDREALERVLARALELQHTAPDPDSLPDSVTEAQLLDLAREVGLTPEHVRQALAEERTRVAVRSDERGLATAVLGAARVAATRVVPGEAQAVLTVIDDWMQREECLVVMRRHESRIVYEPRHDVSTAIRRAMNVGGRGYALTRAAQIAVAAIAIDAGRTRVALDADLTDNRTRLAWGSTTTTAAGVAGAGALAVMGVMLPLAVLPALIAPAVSVASARKIQRRATVRAQLALEQLLDRLERGEGRPPATLLDALTIAASTAAAAVTASTRRRRP